MLTWNFAYVIVGQDPSYSSLELCMDNIAFIGLIANSCGPAVKQSPVLPMVEPGEEGPICCSCISNRRGHPISRGGRQRTRAFKGTLHEPSGLVGPRNLVARWGGVEDDKSRSESDSDMISRRLGSDAECWRLPAFIDATIALGWGVEETGSAQ